MKGFVSLGGALLTGLFLVPAAGRGEDNKTAPLSGGHFAVQVVRDLAYNGAKEADPVKHKLDLYLPRGQKDFPVLFYVHGGAWQEGDRKDFGQVGSTLAKNGIGTVVISYRLSPKVKHPGHIQDVAKAFAWTYKNIARYGGKPQQIFTCGHSAGGHLVALLATDVRYLKAEQLTAAAIKGVISISGVYTIRPHPICEAVFGNNVEECKKASPEEYVKANLPPFLIVYAEHEFTPLDKLAVNFIRVLQKCKCPAEGLRINNRDHTTIMTKAAGNPGDPLIQAMLKFIAKYSAIKSNTNQVKKIEK